MPFKSLERTPASEISAVWVLPPALQQLEECGEADLVQELIVMFQTDTAERLEILRTAVAAADYPAARLEAHTIKGSALQVGANRVADVCRQMEAEARKPQPTELLALFRALLRSFEEVCGFFAATRGPANGSPRYGQ
jgi:HPt (histidine-containing phosphotransfer) domain-containing protein